MASTVNKFVMQRSSDGTHWVLRFEPYNLPDAHRAISWQLRGQGALDTWDITEYDAERGAFVIVERMDERRYYAVKREPVTLNRGPYTVEAFARFLASYPQKG